MRLIILLCLFAHVANAQLSFSFSSYLNMAGSDQIHDDPITVQIDSTMIQIDTKDTTIRHRIITKRYNPYTLQMEYQLTCGGKLRIDYYWDKAIKSFFFLCPGTHLYSAQSFVEAVKNNEYE